jgi:hypothetical protein
MFIWRAAVDALTQLHEFEHAKVVSHILLPLLHKVVLKLHHKKIRDTIIRRMGNGCNIFIPSTLCMYISPRDNEEERRFLDDFARNNDFSTKSHFVSYNWLTLYKDGVVDAEPLPEFM